MDATVVTALEAAGMDTTLEVWFPVIGLAVAEDGEVTTPGDTVVVLSSTKSQPVTLKRISDLFAGNRQPPAFPGEPPPEYFPFFLMIERAAADYCRLTGETVRDKEFEEIYDTLRRRPDGKSEDTLLLHVRNAIRLYMSLRDVSQAEYEGVLRRLVRSARTFAEGYTSTNYQDRALSTLLGG